jgi:aarF domain-containing kinase
MLEESEREREELGKPPHNRGLVVRFLQDIRVFFVNWVVEPIATGLRFSHLVLIFLPVILAIPLVYIGPRLAERSGERTGTILWYAFLLKTLERAGPTFVKVRHPGQQFCS